jgi:drug/metabolite transporter (DMT)-like permease
METLFLKENFSINQIFGVLIVVAAVLWITLIKEKNFNVLESLEKFDYKTIVVATVLHGTGSILQKQAVLISNPSTTTFVNNISAVLTLLLVLTYVNHKSSVKIKVLKETNAHLKDFMLLGLLGFITVYSYNYATQYVPVTVAAAITQLEIPLTLLYAYFFLGEKDLIKRNIIPILALVAGIVMVVWK